jgi:transcriptional regulator with XRE-family HTH domain
MATGLVKQLGEGLEKADLDQAEVAWVLGTSARTVSRWLQEEASPRPEARERILELLAVLEELSVLSDRSQPTTGCSLPIPSSPTTSPLLGCGKSHTKRSWEPSMP